VSVSEEIAPANLGAYLYEIGRKLLAAGQKDLADEIMAKGGVLRAVAAVGIERCEARRRVSA
jgi:hypothetical protein